VELFVETFTTSHFLVFFVLSILLSATSFEVVLDDLIFYIKSSWTPKALTVEVDHRLETTGLHHTHAR